MTLVRTGEQQMTVIGIYKSSPLANGIVVSWADAKAGFQIAAPSQAYVKLRPGSNLQSVLNQVREAIKDNPDINVVTVDQYVAAQTRIFDIILGMVQLLLGLAMIIAIIGLINTLALSMIERTREVGLLRAVGMRRGQIMLMVTTESVVISVFGALLGIAVGLGLGIAVFQPLKDQGLSTLALPWSLMTVYAIASVLVGLGAAFLPALSAARQNVLRAIAYE
jgi:putative ABC transport system permease protein